MYIQHDYSTHKHILKSKYEYISSICIVEWKDLLTCRNKSTNVNDDEWEDAVKWFWILLWNR